MMLNKLGLLLLFLMMIYFVIMCYNCRKIKNNSKHFDPEHDKRFFVVPCGKCQECKNKRRVDYEIRAYYEMKHSESLGCQGLYVTLTYNDAHLPRLFHLPAFSKSDVQKYIKRIRKALSQFGIPENAFTYICCSEYGGETCRPHYHILFFIKDIRLDVFKLRFLVKSKWIKNGFIKFGDNLGVIDSVGAVEYVCKYINKDEDYQDRFKEIFNLTESDDRYTYTIDGSDYFIYKRVFDDFKPFRLTSNHFGEYALECTDDDLLLAGKVEYENKDGRKLRDLPLYLERKKFFNVLYKNGESPRYVLNSGGLLARSVRFDNMLQTVENHVDEVLHNRDYIQDINLWFDCQNIESEYKDLFCQYASCSALVLHFSNLVPDRDDFCRWLFVERGYSIALIDGLSFDDIAELPYKHIDSNFVIEDCPQSEFFIDKFQKVRRDTYEHAAYLLSALSYALGLLRSIEFKKEKKKLDNYKRLIV